MNSLNLCLLNIYVVGDIKIHDISANVQECICVLSNTIIYMYCDIK